MSQLPTFRKLMRWSQVNLLHMQNLVAEVKKLQNITAGYGLQIISASDGIVLALDPSVIPSKSKGEFSNVVLIEEPTEDSTILKVQEVNFRASLTEGESPYEWAPTDVIEAVPDFGFEIQDYKGFFWGITEEQPEPTSNTTFLKLQRNYKQRNILWYPSGGDFRFAVVRSVDDGPVGEDGEPTELTEFSVMAQSVRFSGGNWGFVGEATEIATYPGVQKEYYRPFVFQGAEVTLPNTSILRVFSADGEIWLEQTMRWASRISPGNVSLSDCTPVERITDA